MRPIYLVSSYSDKDRGLLRAYRDSKRAAIVTAPNRGVGRDNPNKTQTIRGFQLTKEQRADLVAFLSR